MLFPQVQAKAQEELDRVVGRDRLPLWDDRPNLPYIRGVVEETLRCELNGIRVSSLVCKCCD